VAYPFNNAIDFADKLIGGFVAANGGIVNQVSGGAVRGERAEPGNVAVINGGGSGHYPAFAGLVGPGFSQPASRANSLHQGVAANRDRA